jgi:hypothetical protein
MRKIFTTRRRIIIACVAAGIVIIGSAGAAYAYFTSTGTGTGSASVGSASNWTVSQPADTSHNLYPGSGSETLTYTVTNVGAGAQAFNSVTPAIATDGSGNVKAGGQAVAGCLAAWFPTPTVISEPPVDTSIAHNGTATVQIGITMTDSGTNQDKCQGINGPDVTLTVNSG